MSDPSQGTTIEDLAIRLWNARTDEAWADADEYQREYVRQQVRDVLDTFALRSPGKSDADA